jgi:hypothetical protein
MLGVRKSGIQITCEQYFNPQWIHSDGGPNVSLIAVASAQDPRSRISVAAISARLRGKITRLAGGAWVTAKVP